MSAETSESWRKTAAAIVSDDPEALPRRMAELQTDILGPGDRIVYVPKPEHRPFIREDRLEVLYVPVDDNGQRPAWKVHHQLNGRPDIVYWVLIDQKQLDRWYDLADTP